MEKELNDRSVYAIERIYQLALRATAYKFCPIMREHYMEFDLSPFDKFIESVADSPVFETFADISKTSDSDSTVERFLLQCTVDLPNSEAPFVESSDAIEVSNEIAGETVELYRMTKTDMFAFVREKNMADTSKAPDDLTPTEGLFLLICKCADAT
jgi:hypothetical protein